MLLLLTTLAGALALSPASRTALLLDDCATALADAQPTHDPAARIAVARCAVEAEQADRAVRLTASVEGPLAGYARLVAAEARLTQGDWAAALQQVEGVSLAGAAGRRLAVVRGRAAVELERWDDARAALAPLLATDFGAAGHSPPPHDADPAEVRWWLAEGALRRGEADKAVPVWRRIWVANPTSPRADLAAARLLTHGKPVPNPASDEGQQLMAARADTFERLRMYPEALALRDQLPAKPAVARSTGEAARDAFDAKDYPRAVSLYDQLTAPGPAQRFHHALATSRTGDYARAAALYTALYEAFPDHETGDQASFKVGYLSYDAGDLAPAVSLLGAHLRRYPKSAFADESRWFIGWSQYRMGELDAADATFAALLQANSRSSLAPGAVYWRARIAEQQGDTAAAQAGFDRVMRGWPVSGYAWFASRRAGAPPAAPTATPAALAPGWTHPDLDAARALADVGLLTWARDHLGGVEGAAKAAGADGVLALSDVRAAAGDWRGAQALVRSQCPRPGQGDPAMQRRCWPRPLGDALAPVAAQYAVPANLPFAIMTAESALQPEVTSIAGARGLMQLMPVLGAQHHAEVYPNTPWHPDRLYDPRVNARLGVHELGTLQAAFGSRGVQPALPMVIAGYNAGTAAVDRWLAAAGPGVEADVWAENIGYTETRRYVRRVLGYLRAYELVYGAD